MVSVESLDGAGAFRSIPRGATLPQTLPGGLSFILRGGVSQNSTSSDAGTLTWEDAADEYAAIVKSRWSGGTRLPMGVAEAMGVARTGRWT
jgi:hypothetical protein